MKHIRFNISTLAILILVFGVGFAALRQSSDIWDCTIFTLTLATLLISILLAVHRTESRRALWLGFTLFGWIYLGLSLVPSIESKLITTKALTFLDSKCRGDRQESSGLNLQAPTQDRLPIRRRTSPSPQMGINLPS